MREGRGSEPGGGRWKEQGGARGGAEAPQGLGKACLPRLPRVCRDSVAGWASGSEGRQRCAAEKERSSFSEEDEGFCS